MGVTNVGSIMKKAGLLASLSSAVLLSLVSVSSYAAPDAARARLNTFFTSINSLQGSFNQQVYSKKGKQIQNASGILYLNRPGKFRWVYKTPDPQVIVGDGKNVWIYDEDLEQVTIKPMQRAMASAPIAILTRKQSPDAQFVVQAMPKASGLDWFKLTPRRPSKDFKYIEVGMNDKTMRQMNMYDQLGQKTVIQLNARTNVPIKGDTFYFKIPAGVDVVGKAI